MLYFTLHASPFAHVCADIICLQETKIATVRVEPDLAFADGW